MEQIQGNFKTSQHERNPKFSCKLYETPSQWYPWPETERQYHGSKITHRKQSSGLTAGHTHSSERDRSWTGGLTPGDEAHLRQSSRGTEDFFSQDPYLRLPPELVLAKSGNVQSAIGLFLILPCLSLSPSPHWCPSPVDLRNPVTLSLKRVKEH